MLSCAFAIAAIVVGAIMGSHVGLIVDRLPREEPIAAGRSRCRACGVTLGPHELVPILSYAAQRGRCRHCDAPLPPDLLIAEIGGGAIAWLALASAPSLPGALALALFGWALLLLALLDWRHYWLPDRITIPLIVAGVVATPLLPAPGWEERLLGAALGYAAFTAIRLGYRALRGRDGLGAGDAKLLAAIGVWLGAEALPTIVLLAAVIGLLAVLIGNRRGRAIGRHDALPFGTPLAVAACVAIPWFA